MSVYEAILEIHERLRGNLNEDNDVIHVEIIPHFEWARLGVGLNGVVLLLPFHEGQSGHKFDLEHILIDPQAKFRVFESNNERTETVSVVATKGNEGWLVTSFLELISMLFEAGVTSDPDSVKRLLENLVALFRALSQPPKKSTQGLWGELFLINHAFDTELALTAWHSTPKDRYDFTLGRERVEVKTTVGPRIHTFSHSQLVVAPGLRVTIASLILSPSSDGITCADLVSQILAKVANPPLEQNLINQVIRTLGHDWQQQSNVSFDPDLARLHLRFFNVEDVPKIVSPIPPHVLNVSYQSDLQTISELDLEQLDSSNGLTSSFVR